MNEVPAIIDAASRDRAVESSGSVLVQAPAGSGKTTLLVQRYLRLLSRVEAPERILALTFTRRAAQEMRERVLLALESAALDAPPPNLAAKTWRLARSAAAHLQQHKIDLRFEPARLRIETIDAFNAWLATQLPIAAGGAGLPVQPDAKRLYKEAARRALAYEGDDVFGRAVERVLELDDQRWLSLIDLLADMLGSRDRWLPLLAGRLRAGEALNETQLAELRTHFDEDLALLMTRVLYRVCALIGAERLPRIAEVMRRAALRAPNPGADLLEWRATEGGLSTRIEDIGRWRAFAQTVLTKAGEWRKALDKKLGFPPAAADKAAMQDLIGELQRDPCTLEALGEILKLPAPAYSDSQWERARDVAQLMVLAAAELEGVFREEGTVDFTAISLAGLRALHDAVGPSDLALRLDYRLQHVLVDEFQDTSSAQLELLKQLTAGWSQDDGRSVFCVGDPMQSIYGFRQAEVRAFLELADQGMGAVHFEVERLASNFRSAPGIVDWVNEHFSRIMPLTDNRERGAIAFRASRASRTELQGGLEIRAFSGPAPEARAIAAAIAAQRATHPDWRIAVLVRARMHAQPLMQALRTAGVAFRALDIETLKERHVVRDLLMLLRALSHLGDRIAWLALLRAPWAGLALVDVWQVARAPLVFGALGDAAILATLSEEGRARAVRLHEVLARAFACQASMPLARWVENTWLALGGAAIAGDERELAGPFFERLQDLGARGLPDVSELDTAFDDLYANAESGAAVEIMTIHKAKGLEFDMVVVPALDQSAPPGRNPLLLAHPFARVSRDGMVMAGKPPVGAAEDPLFKFLKRQVQDASALEAERLLYVACTRAKHLLWLSATLERDTKAGEAERQVPTPRSGSLLRVLWPVAGQAFLDSEPEAGEEAKAAEAAPRTLERLPLRWASPDIVSRRLASETIELSRVEFDWAGETARRVGSLVHAELHRLDLDRMDAAALSAREAYHRRWLAAQGVPPTRLTDAVARVGAALQGVLSDERGQWILKSHPKDDLREHALSGLWQGEVTHAVFDRSFVEKTGVRWVIDYKTSQHLGGGLEEFLDREVERYGEQMRRYAHLAGQLGPEPVRVGLYFPLMRAWKEWALD
jgi:ATP-dependent exoDNAse (exonuclease V) beta subunit